MSLVTYSGHHNEISDFKKAGKFFAICMTMTFPTLTPLRAFVL